MEGIGILLVGFTLICVIGLEQSRHPYLLGLLRWIPAILFAYIIPAIVTHAFDLDLSGIALHDLSRNFIMPLAIIFVMSALSFRQLQMVGIRPIVVFISGSAAVALLPFALLGGLSWLAPSFHEYIIGQAYWKGLVTMVGSWIGGSTSQLVLRELSACPEPLFLVILVMDNVLVNLWTILMFQKIKKSEAINRWLGIRDKPLDMIPDTVAKGRYPLRNAALTLGICLGLVGLSFYFVPAFLLKVVLLSLLGLVLGNFLPFWNHGLVIRAGGYLIILIMAILGLKLNFTNFSLPLPVVLFSVLWLIGHYVVMLLTAYLLRLNMAWVPIGSMANVGGISTAPAVTKAYNEEWMPHAILLAILSMVTGTYWGMLSIYLFEHLY